MLEEASGGSGDGDDERARDRCAVATVLPLADSRMRPGTPSAVGRPSVRAGRSTTTKATALRETTPCDGDEKLLLPLTAARERGPRARGRV